MTIPAPSPSVEVLPSATSTNAVARERAAAGVPSGHTVMAVEQTAGRGQRGNSWEAEPGANATFSIVIRPEGIGAREQFIVSQAVSLAVVDALAARGIEACVKWPNDIYVGERKICGILIENVLRGTALTVSVAGIGINVNQVVFRSDAPNPVSMAMLTGDSYEPLDIVRDVAARVLAIIADVADASGRDVLSRRYHATLWRREGYHPYFDCASGRRFDARIDGVEPSGLLHLAERDGVSHVYAFKEVKAVVGDVDL